MTETEQLRQLVEAREKATKGKWDSRSNELLDLHGRIIAKYLWHYRVHDNGEESYRNAEFAALAGSINLRSILERMEKMEAALEWYAEKSRYEQYNPVLDEGGLTAHIKGTMDRGQRAKDALK